MSNISELRERIGELEIRVAILEKLILDLTEKTNIHHLGSDLVQVPDEDDFENRIPIGYKK